jgi:hypothetical protein
VLVQQREEVAAPNELYPVSPPVLPTGGECELPLSFDSAV